MKANQSPGHVEPDERDLYEIAGPSSLAACIHQVVRNLLGDGDAGRVFCGESADLFKAEVCTACKKQAFMDCQGNCTQSCDLIDQVLSDATVQTYTHFKHA